MSKVLEFSGFFFLIIACLFVGFWFVAFGMRHPDAWIFAMFSAFAVSGGFVTLHISEVYDDQL